MKYPLNVKRDVDTFEKNEHMFHLVYGWRFSDDMSTPSHVKGFDTLAQIRLEAKDGVIPCDCKECVDGIAKNAVTK